MTCHHPEPGSDSDRSYRVGNLIQPIRRTTQIWVETLWNFCARFSDVIWRGNQWHGRVAKCRLWVSGWTRFPGKEIFSLLLSLERQQKRFLKTHFEFAYFSFFLIHLERKRQIRSCMCTFPSVSLKTIPESRPKWEKSKPVFRQEPINRLLFQTKTAHYYTL